MARIIGQDAIRMMYERGEIDTPIVSVEEILENKASKDSLQCPKCPFEAKNANGLRLHMVKHK